MTQFLTYALPIEFIEPYKSKEPDWGFSIGAGNSGSHLNFIDKYSALKEDGTKERWWEVTRRCIEGIWSIYLDYMRSNSRAIDYAWVDRTAMEMYDRMFAMKWMPPGRGLQFMGSKLVNGMGLGDALYNCSFISTKYVGDTEDYDAPFCLIMIQLFMGVGTGFDVAGAGKIPVVGGCDRKEFVVPDSREGWTEATRALLRYYFYGEAFPVFDYTQIRPKGAPIATFGGVCPGYRPLERLHLELIEVLEPYVGSHLNSRGITDAINIIGKGVVSGGQRRSAQLGLGVPTDSDFISIKDWNLEENARRMGPDGWGNLSNNTILTTIDGELPTDLLEKVKVNGEPGLFYRDVARQQGRMIDPPRETIDNIEGLNPCFSGDTLVAVADGRGRVSFKELAEAGLDVPVYTLDGRNRVCVRTMRNPRKTGRNQNMLRIHFDNDTHLDVTPNHKMILLDGTEKQADELVPGDAATILTRQTETFDAIFGHQLTTKNKSDYWMVTTSHNGKPKLEHRLMAEHVMPEGIPKGWVVHHANFNALDNSPENLIPMPSDIHQEIHARHMRGDNNPSVRGFAGEFGESWIAKRREVLSQVTTGSKNPNYSGLDHDALLEAAKELTRSLGRRASTLEWGEYAKKHGYPIGFSGWRKNHFGSMKSFLIRAARDLGYEVFLDLDPRTTRYMNSLVDQGYDIDYDGTRVVFNKHCEGCGQSYTTKVREAGFCSIGCYNSNGRDYTKNQEAAAISIENRTEELRQQQVDAFLDLRYELEREPLKKEWAQTCKNNGISFEISRKSSPFRSWEDLKGAALVRNHRVVKIEEIEPQDVYNGTVDDFHALFTIGNEDSNSYVYSRQCGESNLEHCEVCNLGDVYPINHTSEADFIQSAKCAYMYCKMVTLLPTSWPQVNEVMQRNRRLGVSVNGVAQFIETRPVTDNLNSWMDRAYCGMRDYDRDFSQMLGISESISLTVEKPNGNTSIVAGVTPGVHYPVESGYFLRRIQYSVNNPLVQILKAAGYLVEPAQMDPEHTVVISFPMEGIDMPSERDVTLEHKMDVASDVQHFWADQAVSATFTFLPEEAEQIPDKIKEYGGKELKSLAFLPLGDKVIYPQQPIEKVSRQQWNAMRANVRAIDFQALYSNGVAPAPELYCTTDSCLLETPEVVTI